VSPDETSADPFAAADPFATPEVASDNPFDESPPSPEASSEEPNPFESVEAPPPDDAAQAPADASAEGSIEPAESARPPAEHSPFRILILADFSGRTNRGIMEPGTIASRKIHTIDADNFDQILARIKPELRLPVSDTAIMPLAFGRLDDFRPDPLLAQIEAFQGLLTMRQDLQDPKKFPATAAKVRKLTGSPAPRTPPASAAASTAASDFEHLLQQPIAPKGAAPVDTDAFIANLVTGYGIPDADPEQARLVALLEEALSAGLRAVLRHPAFQALEAAWRGVAFLTSRLNTDESLKICLLDLSREELYADLAAAPALDKGGIFQLLVEQTHAAGTIPFSLVVGDYEFDQSPQDVALLAKLANLLHQASIPFIAGASPTLAGCDSFAKFPDSARTQSAPADGTLWDKIRGHKFAAHLALAAPRILLRLPYGPRTDAIDAFPFDEMPGPPVPHGYLWGNGAFAVAHALAQGFLDGGYPIEPLLDLPDLPCHMATVDGDKEMTPCAQAWLTDRAADMLHQLGLIPLLSVRNAAATRIAGIHSIAKGGKPLAANWASS
jgi:type VI secretion system protein ImpC